MGVAEFASAEYEADDIIGTLAARSRAAGLRNVLVTRDKDLSQLIRDGDVFWDYSGNTRYHYHDIGPRFGVAPELIADFLALTGDSVDNIPGVPGVGKKTAAVLFAVFGSLDELYANLHRIPSLKLRGAAAIAAKLLAHKEAAYLARRLTGIVCDIPLEATLDDLKPRPQNRGAARFLFRYAWIRQYIATAGAPHRCRCLRPGERQWRKKTFNRSCTRTACFRRPQRSASTPPSRPRELQAMHDKAAQDFVGFWADLAVAEIDWQQPFTVPLDDSNAPNYRWFADGQLNVSHNCLDVHLRSRGEKIAIIFEGEPGDVRKLTYAELHREVCRFANALKALGLERGDRVIIYLPLIPEAVIAMQACARIGAVHSVVFGGFSANAVKDRIEDAGAKLVITADGGWRGGHAIELKARGRQGAGRRLRIRAERHRLSTHGRAPARCGRAAMCGGTTLVVGAER